MFTNMLKSYQSISKRARQYCSTLVLLIAFILIPQTSYAEVEAVLGVVVDSSSRKELDDVKVLLLKNGTMVEQQAINHAVPFLFQLNFEKGDKYQLVVTHPDYADHKLDLSNALLSGKMPEKLILSLGAEKGSFVFNGNVKDRENLTPVNNIDITLTNRMTGETSDTVSDVKGNYALNILSGYEYDVAIHSKGYLKRFASINYCGDTLGDKNKYCFSGFNDISLNNNGGVSGASILLDEVKIGKKFKVDNIYYDYNKASLRTDAIPNLRKVLYILRDNKQISIELGSHADSRGSDEYNLALSQRRAESAVDYITRNGINPNRIVAKGYGETVLVNSCSNGVKCTNKEHGANRRTEFIITGIDQVID